MKRVLSLVRKAAEDYNMFEAGDKVAVGVSGGKDSVTLLAALSRLSHFYPKPFEVVAITLDPGFGGEQADFTPIEELCRELQVPYIIKRTNIGQIVFDYRKEPNPCSLCAKMRRGALHDAAKELGCNKVALGHHMDDVVETFMMNLVFEGRLGCFSPVTYLSRKDLTMIRPMIYLSEKEIRGAVRRNNLPVVKNPCPANGFTQRQNLKELLHTLDKDYHGVKNQIFGALKRSHIDRW